MAERSEDAATVDGLARFLYEHRAGGDESGPWTDRRREFYRAFASDILGYLGQPRWGEVREGHYRGLDWDDPERSGTFCGNCMEPWPCSSTRGHIGRDES